MGPRVTAILVRGTIQKGQSKRGGGRTIQRTSRKSKTNDNPRTTRSPGLIVLICDNGNQFTSKEFQRFLKDMGVQQQLTAPYTPQENPTERANRTIKTVVVQLAGNKHQLWDENLAEVTLALNSSTSESTNYTPAFLIQGRELRLPGVLYVENILGSGTQTENPGGKAERLKEVFDITRRNLANAAANQARYYNLRRRTWQPEIGEVVLLKQHPLSKAIDKFAAKLAPKYGGPYTVWK